MRGCNAGSSATAGTWRPTRTKRSGQPQLACAQATLLARAALAPGERVLDVACGTGLVSFAAAEAVGPAGAVAGRRPVGRMVEAARRRAQARGVGARHVRAHGCRAARPARRGFDVALCALGLMYVPDPAQALREMRRVLRPGGRVVLAVWGERSRCGWAPVFPIVEAEVASEVCPLFFGLGAARGAGAPVRGRRDSRTSRSSASRRR